MGVFLDSWTPYRFKPYYEPGAEQGEFDSSAYAERLHSRNLELLERTIEVHADEAGRTPWLTTGLGVVAVERSWDKFDFTSVSLADDKGHFAYGLHFLRQDVTIHPEKGLKARTRVYPTLRRVISLFTSADAAWALMYPTIDSDPEEASKRLREQLMAPHELESVTAESLKELFPLRPVALKYWVGVRAGE